LISSWHGIKYIDPKESGAVLPILHLNGFKISERTIFGCMDHKELVAMFSGYGYQVRFVEDLNDIDTDLHYSMAWAVDEIQKIQKAARSGNPILKPRWPMLILRTPKVRFGLTRLCFMLTVIIGLVRTEATAWRIHRGLLPFTSSTAAQSQV
jgi:phosphoketolase